MEVRGSVYVSMDSSDTAGPLLRAGQLLDSTDQQLLACPGNGHAPGTKVATVYSLYL